MDDMAVSKSTPRLSSSRKGFPWRVIPTTRRFQISPSIRLKRLRVKGVKYNRIKAFTQMGYKGYSLEIAKH